MSSHYTTSEAEAVYDACASIPAGTVITYADLAQLVGRPTTHARTVSTILGHRPNEGASLDPLPWWRVVRSDGSLLDAAQVTGPRAQWVGWALDRACGARALPPRRRQRRPPTSIWVRQRAQRMLQLLSRLVTLHSAGTREGVWEVSLVRSKPVIGAGQAVPCRIA